MMSELCPCGSLQLFTKCCGPYLTSKANAPTPEALMRSRYTAFSKQKFAYLMKTLRGEAAQSFDLPAARRDAPFIKWQKLEVLRSEMDGDTGVVEFKAHFRFKGKLSCLHEVSRFLRLEGEWFYVGLVDT